MEFRDEFKLNLRHAVKILRQIVNSVLKFKYMILF